jgi:hypothetical protein
VPHLLERLDATRFRGVCFYSSSTKQWMIQDSQGRCSAKSKSHLQEADCFVVFDDARCRGADLRLRQSALGLLTVAPGLQKDKLMQVTHVARVKCVNSGVLRVMMSLQLLSLMAENCSLHRIQRFRSPA